MIILGNRGGLIRPVAEGQDVLFLVDPAVGPELLQPRDKRAVVGADPLCPRSRTDKRVSPGHSAHEHKPIHNQVAAGEDRGLRQLVLNIQSTDNSHLAGLGTPRVLRCRGAIACRRWGRSGGRRRRGSGAGGVEEEEAADALEGHAAEGIRP